MLSILALVRTSLAAQVALHPSLERHPCFAPPHTISSPGASLVYMAPTKANGIYSTIHGPYACERQPRRSSGSQLPKATDLPDSCDEVRPITQMLSVSSLEDMADEPGSPLAGPALTTDPDGDRSVISAFRSLALHNPHDHTARSPPSAQSVDDSASSLDIANIPRETPSQIRLGRLFDIAMDVLRRKQEAQRQQAAAAPQSPVESLISEVLASPELSPVLSPADRTFLWGRIHAHARSDSEAHSWHQSEVSSWRTMTSEPTSPPLISEPSPTHARDSPTGHALLAETASAADLSIDIPTGRDLRAAWSTHPQDHFTAPSTPRPWERQPFTARCPMPIPLQRRWAWELNADELAALTTTRSV